MLRLLGFILILPVRLYQIFLSPLLPNSCRHNPTCSQYAIEAIQVWGPFKGLWLAVRRLSKCHPWGTHGDDPVPRR
ncbi:MAG: membrane protein insertion efficiency factor YidD [Flavobacteriales bacterium]|nr:MAG: membrane protein insertion efficiency factor YidD [Flavobacteriales bacterium]